MFICYSLQATTLTIMPTFCSTLYVTTNWLQYTNRYAQRFAMRYTLRPTECSKLTVMTKVLQGVRTILFSQWVYSLSFNCLYGLLVAHRKSTSVVNDNTVLPNLCSECISHGKKSICLALTIPYSPWDFHDSTFMDHGQLPQRVLWELSTNSNSLQYAYLLCDYY